VLRRLGYVCLAVILLLGVFIVSFSIADAKAATFQAQQKAQQSEEERQKAEAEAQAKAETERKHFTLEILGLGLDVEKFRQTWTWEAIEQLSPDKSILPEDPKAYPWSKQEKSFLHEQRAGNTINHAMSWFVEEWPIPTLMVGSAMHRAGQPTTLAAPFLMVPYEKIPDETDNWLVGWLGGDRQAGGLHKSGFLVMETLYSDTPEEALGHAFAFMDAHSEVPAVLISIRDGSWDRDTYSVEGTPSLVIDGYRQPNEMSESFTAFVLARRERVEAMRSHATGNKLADALTPFWDKVRPSGAFHTTEFLTKPWTKEQFAQFDALPVLGRIHRPQTVSYVKDGKPLSDKARTEAFRQGWKAALETLPDGAKPARVLFDCGPGKAVRVAPLVSALYHEGPDLDIHKPKEGTDLTKRLGDTGADSFFVGTALGVIASHRHRDISAVVSFRRQDGATLVMVTPPTVDEFQKKHPGGEDPLNLSE